MRTMFNRPWLVIATCFFVSGCTGKTVVSGPPTGSDADAATETAESTTLGDMVAVPDSNPSDPTDAVDSESSSTTPGTTAANMVNVDIESNNQVSSNSQTTITQLSPDQLAAAQAAAVAAQAATAQAASEQSTVEQTNTEQIASSEANATQGSPAQPTGADAPVTLDDLDLSTQETSGAGSESTTDSSSETAVAEATPVNNELLADPVAIPDVVVDAPIEPASIGAPGADVDCELALPCSWLSDDSQFVVTVTSADNIGALGQLLIEYSVSSLHDTDVSISSTEAAIDSAGDEYEISALRFGEAEVEIESEAEGAVEDADAQGLLAGESIPATIQFSNASSADSIDYWSIGLSDSGLLRQAVFSGIPIGSATTLAADCINALPCVWESPARDVNITLLAVSDTGSINQLSASFEVETTRDLTVAVDAGATATGIDGTRYAGRTHTIGTDTGAGKLTNNTLAGTQVSGAVFFFRTQSISEALQSLSLVIYEDSPVPRWNPEYLNVPVQ